MKSFIHVNQHNIKANAKWGETQGVSLSPVITVKDYKQNRRGMEAVIRDPAGNEVARVVYRPEHPLSCGARVWIETELSVDVA